MPRLSNIRLTRAIIEKAPPGAFISDAGVRGLGLRVSASGRRSFVLTYRLQSNKQGRITLGVFPTLTVDEARDAAQKQLGVIANGGDPSDRQRTERAAATVADLITYYCGEYAKAADLKAGTVRDAASLLERFVRGHLGRRKVADITPSDIRHVQAAAKKAAGPYQANKLVAVLRRMFTIAVGERWRLDNPCAALKKYPEDQRHRHLSDDEIGRLLRACDAQHDQRGADAIRLLLFTGARLREVLWATWDQFDLERGVWIKPSSHTKTKKQHLLELEGPAIDVLKSMQAAEEADIFLFPGRKGDKPRVDLKGRGRLS